MRLTLPSSWISYNRLFPAQESELQGTITDLHSQLEAEKQHSELAKVRENHTQGMDSSLTRLSLPQVEISELTARLLAAQQQVRVCIIAEKLVCQANILIIIPFPVGLLRGDAPEDHSNT